MTRSVLEKFESRYIPEPNTGCWLWVGHVNCYGYGAMFINGKIVRAHAVSYELHTGPRIKGLELDHLCRVKTCVNPRHLEQVTHLVNVQRYHATLTCCARGHEYTADNLGQPHGKRKRICLTCNRVNQQRYKKKLKGILV